MEFAPGMQASLQPASLKRLASITSLESSKVRRFFAVIQSLCCSYDVIGACASDAVMFLLLVDTPRTLCFHTGAASAGRSPMQDPSSQPIELAIMQHNLRPVGGCCWKLRFSALCRRRVDLSSKASTTLCWPMLNASLPLLRAGDFWGGSDLNPAPGCFRPGFA